MSANSLRKSAIPSRIAAFGGGTGLSNLLRGLKKYCDPGQPDSLTAVVTMSDDGGSSGRLRRCLGVPPPGDIRSCMVALADQEDLLAGLFEHRYGATDEIGGHNLGNLILAALAEQTGSFLKAVEVSCQVLRTRGRILPATLDDVVLEAKLENGTVIRGESAIGECREKIAELRLQPEGVSPTPGVIESILNADLVVLGPGSLYTSLIPHLLIEPVAEALRNTKATVLMVANLVSERGEGAGLTLEDHVEAVVSHAGGEILAGIVVNDTPVDDKILKRYQDEESRPLYWDADRTGGFHIEKRNLLAEGPKLRHQPEETVRALFDAWKTVVGHNKEMAL